MHSSGLRISGLREAWEVFPEILRKAAKLSAPEGRLEAAAELAKAVGGKDLIIFISDPELNTFIAAPGFRSAIPGGKLWKTFLAQCVANGEQTAKLPHGSIHHLESVLGIAPTPEAVLVLVGTESIGEMKWISELLPLFTAMFRGEQAAVVASANARVAADAALRTQAMAEVISDSRLQLEKALSAAEGAREAAVKANRVKSEFLATMSHELRTPLNAIGGYTQLLAMGIHGNITKEQKATLERIDRSQRHLLGLINNILNLARIEAGKVEYQSSAVEVKEIMEDISPMIEPQLAFKSLEFTKKVAPGISVFADRDKAEQVLLNILSNAVKFTNPGGRIAVDAQLSDDPRTVNISISDTGHGIPASKINSIFDPFTQVDASHSRVGQGAGLGLAISRDLARGMGGDVVAKSELGVGSTFTLILPAGPATSESQKQA